MKKTNKKFEICNTPTKEQIQEMISLDKSVFLLEDMVSIEKCLNWFNANNQIYTALIFEDRVVGYTNFMPIKKTAYKKFKSGKITEQDITSEDIVQFSTRNYCLFDCIVVKKEFNDGRALFVLYKALMSKLYHLGVKKVKIVMDCVTTLGEKSAKNLLKAKYVRASKTGKIYKASLNVGN